MRKIFTKIAICLAVMTMAVGTTSCDNEIVKSLLDMIMGGKDYVYQGTYSCQLYRTNTLTGNLAPYGDPVSYPNSRVVLTSSNAAGNGSSVKLTFPGAPVDYVTMSEVVLSGLTLSGEDIEINDMSRGTSTLTISDGSTLNLTAVNLTAKATTETLRITDVELFYGEDQDYAIVLTFPDGIAIPTNNLQ